MSYDKDPERSNADRYVAENEQVQRENTSALSGMTLGIVLALLVAAIAGTFYFLNRRDEPAPTIAPAAAPSTLPSSAPPEKQTIIREEKTRELVPVPQSASPQPNVNIIVPPSAPAAPSSPDKASSPQPSASAGSPSPTAQEATPSASPTTSP